MPFKTNFHVSLMDKEGSEVTVRRLGHERKELDWVKLKVKFTLEQATKAQRGSRGIALLVL
jgi:hypothetical protein